MSARVLTTEDGCSFDLFQLMDQHGDVLNEMTMLSWSGAWRPRLQEQPEAPVKRTMPRRLRHFDSEPEVRFTKDPDRGGTVLHLHCNDQPGLLSRIAAAIFKQGVQVHNARIATFGERVEDTFLISDPDHQPLTDRPGSAASIREH